MQQLIDEVSAVYIQWSGKPPVEVEVLPQSGSDRRYFRLYDEAGKSVIGTHGINVPENEAFIYFAGHFFEKALSVPQILASSEDKVCYLQEDFGDVSLLSILEQEGFTESVYALFRESLHQL